MPNTLETRRLLPIVFCPYERLSPVSDRYAAALESFRAPYTLQSEQGTRYHFALYGHVMPLWTSISRKGTMDIEGP